MEAIILCGYVDEDYIRQNKLRTDQYLTALEFAYLVNTAEPQAHRCLFHPPSCLHSNTCTVCLERRRALFRHTTFLSLSSRITSQ